ncbi:MAG: D-alanine--D-alanine ligase [Clostridia bacterium]|nr:D-alanine--D-alanine ligase [Clostridia bacterium]
MNIVVLAGGTSAERDVSLSSGAMICAALRGRGGNALLLDSLLGSDERDLRAAMEAARAREYEYAIGASAPDMRALRSARGGSGCVGENVLELCMQADMVFIALHGENGEDGRFQALFDLLGVRYTGSGYLASALAMDKWVSKQLLARGGVRVPDGALIRRGDCAPVGQMELPCVVKPVNGGSSIGVTIVRSEAELKGALEEGFRYSDELLAERYIAGRELSVGILGDEALPVIEIAPKQGFYDYKNKYQAGACDEMCPADIAPELAQRIRETALKAHRILGLSVYSRIDFMLRDDGEHLCLEANTLPGMTPTSLVPQEALAAGVSYGELCERIIALSLAKYEEI